ncbi:hypothetical protein [Spirosoma sp.]|uniref:hypothetical protein n=1 Tax=Spirosoma sp. TaxID=1899569 RepID=UPI002639B7F4|nr:hypothetical protein [Spirosoma sp.]MCX6217645.1 hypothetical protein [Spirosoma sp.]
MDATTREMTRGEVSIFICLEQAASVDGLFKEIAATAGGWVLKAIEKRFEAHGLTVDKKVMIFILTIGNGVVGQCAQHVDNMAEWAGKQQQTQIDWRTFTHQIYPHGIPVF